MRCAVDNFSDRLKMLRKIKGVTQAQVIAALNIGRTTYTDIEQGNTQPTIKTLCLLADYFDVSTDYLLGRLDEPSTEQTNHATTQD